VVIARKWLELFVATTLRWATMASQLHVVPGGLYPENVGVMSST